MIENEYEELGKTLWKHALIGLAVINREGLFVDANPAFCSIVEYTYEELRTRTITDLTHPSDSSAERRMTADLLSGRTEAFDMRKRYITKTNRTIWVVMRVVAFLEDKEVKYFVKQISAVMELAPPKLPGDSPAIRSYRSAMVLEWVRQNWVLVATLLSSIAIIISNVLQNIKVVP